MKNDNIKNAFLSDEDFLSRNLDNVVIRKKINGISNFLSGEENSLRF